MKKLHSWPNYNFFCEYPFLGKIVRRVWAVGKGGTASDLNFSFEVIHCFLMFLDSRPVPAQLHRAAIWCARFGINLSIETDPTADLLRPFPPFWRLNRQLSDIGPWNPFTGVRWQAALLTDWARLEKGLMGAVIKLFVLGKKNGR
jgi:hypothetical protein